MSHDFPDIKVNLSALQYTLENTLPFSPVNNIVRDSDERIAFTVLLQIKQKRDLDYMIGIELVKFDPPVVVDETDDKVNRRQQTSRLELKDISLKSIHDEAPDLEMGRFIRDPWSICNILRYNFADVPTKGAGSYAIVAYLKNSDGGKSPSLQDKEFLDCDYFEVVEAN